MDSTKPKFFVFVLMPFSDEFKDIYELGIKQACDEAGAYCERVDEQIFDDSILDRVYNQIAKADAIVADMTGRNPNVFYETGYAHALDKRAILLTQTEKDIPFDLKHYPHIVYEGKIVDLKEELVKRIRWCVDNPKESLSRIDVNVEFVLNGQKLKNDSKVHWKLPHLFDFELAVQNTGSLVLKPDMCSFGLILPKKIVSYDSFTKHNISDAEHMLQLKLKSQIFPDDWATFSTGLDFTGENSPMQNFDCSIRIFSELGSKDIPFCFTMRD